MVTIHVSARAGQRVIGSDVGLSPNACPPCAYRCISVGTLAFFSAGALCVIAALVGQGLSAFDAAVLGVWAHGRSGDHGAMKLGQTALTATDLIDHLPAAFRELETHW